jgi:hypothetical protein
MKFFTSNITISSIIPFIDNEQDFMFIRDRLLNRPTATEHQIASRIVQTIDPKNNETVDNPLVQIRLNQQSKWATNLILHYKHEQRFTSYNLTKTLVQRRPQYQSKPIQNNHIEQT